MTVRIIALPSDQRQDSYAFLHAPIGPADHLGDEGDLAPILLEITPPMAPALACWVDIEFAPCVLPLTGPGKPGEAEVERDDPPSAGWLMTTLSRLPDEKVNAKRAENLAALLSAGPIRPDGLPGWWTRTGTKDRVTLGRTLRGSAPWAAR
jgi:hypothetical protein